MYRWAKESVRVAFAKNWYSKTQNSDKNTLRYNYNETTSTNRGGLES